MIETDSRHDSCSNLTLILENSSLARYSLSRFELYGYNSLIIIIFCAFCKQNIHGRNKMRSPAVAKLQPGVNLI